MFNVEIKINNQTYFIHNEKEKLIKGQIKQGINSIDSFSFDILPNNSGFNYIHDFKTLISVYNHIRERYEFQGRVLYSTDSMDDKGLITKSVICESFLGFLQDTEQDYIEERNWTPTELLTQLLTIHNELLSEETEKHFKVGTIFSEENIFVGIQRETTWKCIQDKILGQIGGEIALRIENDGMYIDIVEERGYHAEAEISLSKNMKSIKKESNPTSYITRLIPLGAKIKDDEGNDTEERVTIEAVNNGIKYIEDEIAKARHGINYRYEYWDDVHESNILLTKARNYLANNNKVLQKYSINALDLAMLGIDIDWIDVCNYHKVKNHLLNIDDTLRVISKTIDIVNISSTSIEIGDKFKTLTDLEIDRNNKINQSINTIEKIESNYVTNQKITSITNELYSSIDQTAQSIELTVSENYTSKSAFEEYQKEVTSQFTQTSEGFEMTFENIIQQITNIDGTVNKNYEELVRYIRFNGGTITLGEVGNPLTMELTNDRLSFKQNGVEVAYISNNRLYIYDGEFINSLKLGRWVFLIRASGNLSLTYI